MSVRALAGDAAAYIATAVVIVRPEIFMFISIDQNGIHYVRHVHCMWVLPTSAANAIYVFLIDQLSSAQIASVQGAATRAGERSETRAATCSSESGSGGEAPRATACAASFASRRSPARESAALV